MNLIKPPILLLLIALIIVLYFEDKHIVIIEEPDRYIHPHLISKVIEMMKDASRNKQIIITTHNPEVVKHTDIENILLEFSNITSTDASFAGDADLVPRKIKFFALAALIDFILNLPKTKHNASEILLFPEPFGPRRIFIPGVKSSSVFFGKLLNPYITSFFIYAIKEIINKGF